MKRSFTAILLILLFVSADAQKRIVDPGLKADEVVTVWDNSTAPHSNFQKKDEVLKGHSFSLTSSLDLYIYKADEKKNTGYCMVYYPGGSYKNVNACDTFPQELKAMGIAFVLVKYRLPNYGHGEATLEDGIEALRYMKANAAKYGIDPEKIGIAGGSAGGHLAAWVANTAPDDIFPSFCVLLYPATCRSAWWNGATMNEHLLGKNFSPEQLRATDVHSMVTSHTPRTLMFYCDDDRVVPVLGPTEYYIALKDHGVAAELHLFPSGGHAWDRQPKFKYRKEFLFHLENFILGRK